MIRVLAACAVAVLVAGGLFAAPKPKETEKPLPPATAAQRDESVNNLKQIGLAMHNFHDVFGHLPANYLIKGGKVGLSWRVAVLPFLEEEELYKKFKLDEPWDSEHNLKLVDRMPKIYAPIRVKTEKGQTFYQMFAGESTLLGPNGKGIHLAAVTDGLSNTFMAVEGGQPVTWTRPDDLPFDGKTVPKLGGMFDGQFHALFGDGAVRRMRKGIDSETLRRLIDRQDGEVVNIDGATHKASEKD